MSLRLDPMAFSLTSHRLHSLVLGLLLFLTPVSADNGALSICEYQPISGLRLCASWCITFGNTDHCDKLAMFLSCGVWGGPQSAIRNDCYCRPDLFSTAHSFLSSCVNSACSSNSVDVTQAISVYDGYCNSAGEFQTFLTLVCSHRDRSAEVELTKWRLGYTAAIPSSAAATTSFAATSSRTGQSSSKGSGPAESSDPGVTSTIMITTAPSFTGTVTKILFDSTVAAAPVRGAIILDRWNWRVVVLGFGVFVLAGLGQFMLNL